MRAIFKISGVALLLLHSVMAQAGAIRSLSGFTLNNFGANDDGSYPCVGTNVQVPVDCAPLPVPIGFSVNFYGATYTNLYLNNNGNITFSNALAHYAPFELADTETAIIAPFFADVDTRIGNTVTFGTDVVDGHQAFGVNWLNVGFYAEHTDKLNSFQLILINRSDRNPGDFDIEFNYGQIQWETGDINDGVDGLGGASAVAGFSNGSGEPGTSFQLGGSGAPGEFLDNNPGGLIHGDLNTNILGRYLIPIVNHTLNTVVAGLFSQYDPRWASHEYGNSGFTIAQKGSALCTLAMALQAAGVPMDPTNLNAVLTANGDFVGTAVNWDAATRDASATTLVFHPHRTSDVQYLSQQAAGSNAVIIGVNINEDGAPGHFVLVTGEQNGQFLINDPGHLGFTNLAQYNYEFETRGYVGASSGNAGGLDISLGNSAGIFAANPAGQRTGYVSGGIDEEISQSVYFLDCVENDDLTGAPGSDTAHLIEIPQPSPGNYQVFVVGAGAGSSSNAYTLGLRSFAASGAAGVPQTLPGVITNGTVIPLAANFGGTNVALTPFTNIFAWFVNTNSGLPPLSVQFSTPATDIHGNVVTNWFWSFGDNSISTNQNPLHTYQTSGNFFPNLTALNTNNAALVAFGPSINALFPLIQITASPANGSAPLTVQFTSPAADTNGVALTGWRWDFGDGSASGVRSPSHTYNTIGVYIPGVLATNAAGLALFGAGPPITVLPGVQQTVPAGSNDYFGSQVQLCITGLGASGSSYQWLQNGEPLTDGGVISGSGTPCLSLDVVTNTSQYEVLISGGFGVLTSQVFTVEAPLPSGLAFTKGTFNGLFYPLAGMSPTNSGAFKLTETSAGRFSGSERIGAASAGFSGKFNANGSAQVTNKVAGKKVILSLQIDTTPGLGRIAGTITDGGYVSVINAFLAGRSAAAPARGQMLYTLAMPGGANALSTPVGWSTMTGSLNAAGALSLAGSLADGTKFSQSTSLSTNGAFPLFQPLYTGKGLLLGWMQFATNAASGDAILWIKPAGLAAQAHYQGGFTLQQNIIASPYAKPAPAGNALTLSNNSGFLVLTAGNLSPALTNTVSLSKGKVIFALNNPNKMVFTVSPGSGAFSGSFMPLGSAKKEAFGGVILQQQGMALGWFLGPSEGGIVTLSNP